jgi:hypothetical protein
MRDAVMFNVDLQAALPRRRVAYELCIQRA